MFLGLYRKYLSKFYRSLSMVSNQASHTILTTQTEPNEVFVYGSLKKGLSGHQHMEGAAFSGKAITFDKYFLTSNQYPFLSKSKEMCYVRGECYIITKEILDRLDEYEEVPEYYT